MSGSVPGAIQPITPYQPPDAIGMAGQYGQLQNLLLGNQVTQQQLNSKNAIGADFQGSIDPRTGQFNPTLFAQKIAADPNAKYGAPDAYNQAQTTQSNQYGLNQSQLAQTNNRLNTFRSAMGSIANNPNAGPGDVYTLIKGLHAAGAPTDEVGDYVANTMPVPDPSQANNPAYMGQYQQAFNAWKQQTWGGSLSGEAQANVFRPNVSFVDTGGQTQAVDTNPTTNPGITSTTLSNTLTPAQAASPVQGTTSNGTPYYEPTSTFAQQTGNGNLVAPGGGAGSVTQSGGSIFGTGRLPGRGAPYAGPTASAGSGSGATPDVPPGTLQAGIGPAQAAAAAVAGTGSANDLHSLYANVSTSGVRLYQLNQALTSLQALGPQGTGPNTATYNNIKSFLQSVPGIGGAMPFDPNKIANYDEANKYLTAYASNQAANLGAGTDSKLATALSSNANTHISNLAATNVVKATIGLERMQQAQAQAFTQTGLPASSYDQWSASWNKTADARAYAFDLMSPQQRGAVLSGMTGTSRTQFLNQVWSAAQSGFIDPGKLGLSAGSSGSAGSPAPAQSAPAASGPTIDPNTGLPVGIAP